MLAIRMQRTGRKGHAMFRVIVQDAQRTPTSGKIVTQLGSYDPHAKAVTLDKDKAAFYLEHGAQPSERVARLLKAEGVKLPAWVKLPADKERPIRNADKRRSTRPAPAEAPATEAPEAVEPPATEVPVEATEPEAEAVVAADKLSEDSAETEEPVAENTEATDAAEPPAETDEADAS